MKILVTNDDGVSADGLWILVRELANIAEVVVVAPDREQSAAGTAVTLWEPLRIRKVQPVVHGVETYAVEGTPSDSVLLALGSLIKGKVDLVVSGINWGLNLGDDIYISGTVSAALQGYLHGHPALAVSAERDSEPGFQIAARLVTMLAGRFNASPPADNLMLNINEPNALSQVAPEVSELSSIGAVEIEGVEVPSLITRKASTTLELNSGQTFAMAGLLQHNVEAVRSRIPGIGDLPVIGPNGRGTTPR